MLKVIAYFVDKQSCGLENPEIMTTAKTLGVLTVCSRCNESKLCACRFSKCVQCDSTEQCKCVCACCKAEFTNKSVKKCTNCLSTCGTCDDCIRDVVHGANLCRFHKCLNEQCLERKLVNKAHCHNHACKAVYCDNFAVNGSCLEHRCFTEGCETINNYSGKYCIKHACTTEDCKYEITRDSKFCDTHICKIDDCINEKYILSNYCSKHTCTKCNNAKIEGSICCGKHTCKVEKCLNGVKSNGGVMFKRCRKHSCDVVNCGLKRQSRYYCEIHGCKTPGCDNGVYSNKLCINHFTVFW